MLNATLVFQNINNRINYPQNEQFVLTAFMFGTQRHQTGDKPRPMSRVPNPKLFDVRLTEVHELLHADELFEAFCEMHKCIVVGSVIVGFQIE